MEAVSSLAVFDHAVPAAWAVGHRPSFLHSCESPARECPFGKSLLTLVLAPPNGASHCRHEQAQWIVGLVTQPSQFLQKSFSLQSVTLLRLRIANQLSAASSCFEGCHCSERCGRREEGSVHGSSTHFWGKAPARAATSRCAQLSGD
jgi:hypothetical protein